MKTILIFIFAPIIIGWYTILFVISQFNTSIFGKPRKDLSYKTILITGAATGLGRALALQYASPGTLIIIQDDKQVEKELNDLATSLQHRGSKTEVGIINSNDKQAISNWIVDMTKKHGVINMFVSNSHYTDGGSYAEKVSDVNVAGAFEMLHPVLEETKKVSPKVTQQIVVVTTPTALLKTLKSGFTGLSFKELMFFGSELRARVNTTHGIRVNVILPGFISMHGYKRSFVEKLIGITDREAVGIIQTRLLWDVPFISLANSAYLFSWFAGLLPLPVMDLAQMYINRSPVAGAIQDVMIDASKNENKKVKKPQPKQIQTAAHPHHEHHELTQEEQDKILNETSMMRTTITSTPRPELLPLENFGVPATYKPKPTVEKKHVEQPKKEVKKPQQQEPVKKQEKVTKHEEPKPKVEQPKPVEKKTSVAAEPKKPSLPVKVDEHKPSLPVKVEEKPSLPVKVEEQPPTKEQLLLKTLTEEERLVVEADKAVITDMYKLPANARLTLLTHQEEEIKNQKIVLPPVESNDNILIQDGVLIADESPEVADEIVHDAMDKEIELLKTCTVEELEQIRLDKESIFKKYSLPSNARVVLVDLIDED
ncbi:hypothetical protein AKO1_009104, partial [Acrasis kona]